MQRRLQPNPRSTPNNAAAAPGAKPVGRSPNPPRRVFAITQSKAANRAPMTVRGTRKAEHAALFRPTRAAIYYSGRNDTGRPLTNCFSRYIYIVPKIILPFGNFQPDRTNLYRKSPADPLKLIVTRSSLTAKSPGFDLKV